MFDKFIDLLDDIDKKAIMALVVLFFFLLGTVLGFSMSLNHEASKIANMSIAPPAKVMKQPVRVLGLSGPTYVNPFHVLNAATMQFPLTQLNGCRNWSECQTYCSYPENFQACVAWSKTQKK